MDREALRAAIRDRFSNYHQLSPAEQRQLDQDMRLEDHLRREQESRDGMRTMAEHGWYLDPHWISRSETYIAELLATRPPAEIEEQLCEAIERSAAGSLADLSREHPQRAHLLEQAYAAHRRQEYALSIPVLLMQADGICHELAEVQLHARDGAGRMRLTQKFGDADDGVNLFLSVLLEVHPIAHNERERAARPQNLILNRHAVLHGESVDYATRANSCRAMSYVRFVAWVVGSAAERTD